MSRGKGAPGSKGGGDVYQGPAGGSRGKIGVGRLNSGTRKPLQGQSGVSGAGYGSKAYLGAGANPSGTGGGGSGSGLNAFNIPKYG